MQSPGAVWLEGSEGARLSAVDEAVSEEGANGIMDGLAGHAKKLGLHCKSSGRQWEDLKQ